jgi:hypothetical protein
MIPIGVKRFLPPFPVEQDDAPHGLTQLSRLRDADEAQSD